MWPAGRGQHTGDRRGPRDPAAPAAPRGYTPKHLADRILTSRSAIEGERKQVTVVFVDCAGFTELSARLDPEDLHGVMDGCFQHLLEAIHRFEGTVNQFTGDGVMALFGAPIAHEDHAVRAVAAALAIEKAVRQYAATLRAQRGIDFAVRIGINTGPVVVGKIGDDLRMDYTAQGETVNLAARLQQVAPPGGTRISEATMRLVSGYFVIEPTGQVTLKGLPAPVATFTATRQLSGRARFDLALERGLTAFVGRQRALAFLRDAFDKTQRGRGNVLSVVGPAGIGKSRLAYELKRGLAEDAVTFLSGRCHQHGEALPFNLIAQLLQMNFMLDDGEAEKDQVEKVETGVRRLDPALEWTIPYLKHVLALPAEELDVQGLDEAQRKQRLVEAVRTLTLRGAQRRPLFLLMEDLQWIDSSSRDYLDSVVDSLANHPVFLLCTYREGYTPAWDNRAFHQRLALDPFTEDETAQMVAELVDRAPVTGPARELIVKRAEGNPLFIEELTAYLENSGLLTAGDGAALANAGVPATIQDLLTARIDRLPESAKRLLQAAAVLGREFSHPLLEAVAPTGVELAAELATLARADLLNETAFFPEQRYRFVHPLVQQVAYQSLLVKSRAELHARAGRALEALSAERPEEALQELARHYSRSAEHDKALRYLAAGRRPGAQPLRLRRCGRVLPAGARRRRRRRPARGDSREARRYRVRARRAERGPGGVDAGAGPGRANRRAAARGRAGAQAGRGRLGRRRASSARWTISSADARRWATTPTTPRPRASIRSWGASTSASATTRPRPSGRGARWRSVSSSARPTSSRTPTTRWAWRWRARATSRKPPTTCAGASTPRWPTSWAPSPAARTATWRSCTRRSTTCAPASTAARGWRWPRRSATSCSRRGSSARWPAGTARWPAIMMKASRLPRPPWKWIVASASAVIYPFPSSSWPRSTSAAARTSRARGTIAKRSRSPARSGSRSCSSPATTAWPRWPSTPATRRKPSAG